MEGWTMQEIENKELKAPCGLYCGTCSIYIATRDNNEKFMARETEKAIEYLLLAGDKARLENSFDEARHNYLRLIDLLGELGNQEGVSRTWSKLGLVYLAMFQFDEAQKAYEKAFSLQSQACLLKKSTPYQVPSNDGWVLHQGEPPIDPKALDPGYSDSFNANEIVNCLFAGLVEYDLETNIMPHAARSWEVLDDGCRYIFHLRDDVRWTDGTPVTAADFEWACLNRFANQRIRSKMHD